MNAEPNTVLADLQRGLTPLSNSPLHVALAGLQRARLAPETPHGDWPHQLVELAELSLREGHFLEQERAATLRSAAQAPGEAAAFASWFDALLEHGPGQHDPLFDYLAKRATLEEMRWFLRQEVAGEAGFDDLVALTQLRLPARAKLELARNYWDEMGRGKAVGMHGPMLSRLAEALQLQPSEPSEIVWDALAVGNVLAGLAYNRRYAFHSVGALGAVELTAPSRAVKVVAGLDRLGVAREHSHYFRLHSTLDVAHARAWRDEVLVPLVSERPELARPLAEGALMRLNAGARAFVRYRREFARNMAALRS